MRTLLPPSLWFALCTLTLASVRPVCAQTVPAKPFAASPVKGVTYSHLKNDVELEITCPRTFGQNTPFMVRFEVTNRSKQRIRLGHLDDRSPFSARMIEANGQKVGLTPKGQELFRPVNDGSHKYNLIFVEAGASYTESYDLAELFRFQNAGEHHFLVFCEVNGLHPNGFYVGGQDIGFTIQSP